MSIVNIQLSQEDADDLDGVKEEIGAKGRPETIRFLMRIWWSSQNHDTLSQPPTQGEHPTQRDNQNKNEN